MDPAFTVLLSGAILSATAATITTKLKTCRPDSPGGHKFEPRYDETPNPKLNSLKVDHGPPEETRKLMILRIYVRDVCVGCGKTIERLGA